MRYARELAGGALVAAVALAALRFGGRSGLLLPGVLAGLAAGVREAPADAAVRGAAGGAVGAVAFVAVAAGLVFVRLEPALGPAFALDPTLFTAFAMLPLLLPLYLVEGAMAGPVVAWASGRARKRMRVRA